MDSRRVIRLPIPRAAAAVLAVALAVGPAAPDAPSGTATRGQAPGELRGEREKLLAALERSPRDFQLLCRLSRTESDLGEDAAGAGRRRLVSAAVEHAREAVGVAPESAQGHLALAVALGRQALREGPRTRLALAREVKSEVDRALALDPGLGGAYHVRALWNRNLASLNFLERAVAKTVAGGLPRGASMANAVRDLEKAVALEPAFVNHHLELGRTYAELERWGEARRALETALALPPHSSPRDPVHRSRARELLARIRER